MFNYPNPFKNTTNIVYTLPESGKVRLVLTNMYGKTVRVLVDEMQSAGSYTVTVNPYDNTLVPGVYLYKIEVQGATDSYVKVNKMLFTR
jgi:archaellum component FlaG (FlaF/FlaG flagellin family)